MDIIAVIEEVEDALRTIEDLRVWNPENVAGAGAFVWWPEEVEFDQTYRRGSDRISSLPVMVLAANPLERTAQIRIAPYCKGSGDFSIKKVLEDYEYTTCDVVVVTGIEFEIQEHQGVKYLAAVFTLDIVGTGEEE